jgi:membrane peptidoglycan carboxypeptidase
VPSSSNAPLRVVYALLASIVAGLLLAAVAFPLVGGLGLTAKAGADEFLVLPKELETAPLAQRTRILAADGSQIAVLYRQNRVNTALKDVPELTRQAVIATEDARFYSHHGVDVKGTLRAAVENAQAGGVSQGGSTLTQQYVKNALLQAADGSKTQQDAARELSLERKMKEARYALAIERTMSKDEILERYLNIAYFGNGTYGIGTATSFYFGKPVSQLTLAEGATLAGIVQSPGRFDPVKALRDPAVMEALLSRRATVLSRMASVGFISEAERAAATAEKPVFTIRPVQSGCEAPGVQAPFFCDHIRRVLETTEMGAALGATREERQGALLAGGLTIRTTLDPKVQSSAQRAAEEHIPPADTFRGADYGAAVAVDVVEPGTGAVKAMAVNRRYSDAPASYNTKVNLATGGSSGFQGGSTFKAFVLADALRQGFPLGFSLYSPQEYESPVFDEAPGGPPYTPENAGDSESGTFDMRTGTHHSVNTYYVQLEERTGVEGPASLAESMGVRQFAKGTPSAPLNRGGSFVLGGNEVSPLAMAGAYATFAARGLYCPPRAVTSIVDASGKELALPAQKCNQVLEQPVADTVNSVLRGVVTGGSTGSTGQGAQIGRPAAGKTGTTNGSKAAWFVGYTPQLSTAIWVGDPGAPGRTVKEMKDVRINGRFYDQVYGGTIPATIFRDTMRSALEGAEERSFAQPDRLANSREDVRVPVVAGLPLDEAERVLIEAGLSVRDGGRVSGSRSSRGEAAYTSPRAGRRVDVGDRVTLYEGSRR